ncbi:Uncharacterised protein [Burkholderia pseudomallei]|nr:Uncharacterised protein [Burkholderia pseudomallei]
MGKNSTEFPCHGRERLTLCPKYAERGLDGHFPIAVVSPFETVDDHPVNVGQCPRQQTDMRIEEMGRRLFPVLRCPVSCDPLPKNHAPELGTLRKCSAYLCSMCLNVIMALTVKHDGMLDVQHGLKYRVDIAF